jgi:CCR4-NOT transcription complex subunit 9
MFASCDSIRSVVTPVVSIRTMMAGLISPKPVHHPQGAGQYSGYTRGLSAFSETPPLSSGSAAPQLGSFPNAGASHALALQTDAKIYNLVVDLMDPATREAALLELSKKREQYDDLALVLWHSFGTTCLRTIFVSLTTTLRLGIMPILLQEIVSVYPLLSPPNLTAHVSNRVCNALALLQCVASHSDTRQLFLNGIVNSSFFI